jgi:tetratricopeptide repeat protein 30
VKRLLQEYDDHLEKYVPVVMGQASIYWDMQNYAAIEKLFRKSFEFCHDHDTWGLNAGHVLFMQESNKFKKAIEFYEPIVKKHYDGLLNVSPIVLANLCVSYVMSSQNDEAEDLMRKIEREEDKAIMENPARKMYHLCIVNLVIGTLYCAKGNYEFGISRVMKSLEPYQKKLGTDTWYYTKRCFLSLFENMAKQIIMLKDPFIDEIIQFLTHCESKFIFVNGINRNHKQKSVKSKK